MIVIGKEFEDLVVKKYFEMKESGLLEDFLDKDRLGNVKLFINSKPLFILSSFIIKKSDVLYVGSNNL